MNATPLTSHLTDADVETDLHIQELNVQSTADKVVKAVIKVSHM